MYSGDEEHSSYPADIVSDIAAGTTQSLTETANFTRVAGNIFQGSALSTRSTRFRGKAGVPKENPWHREFKAKLCEIQTPTMLDRVYAFLFSSSSIKLRIMEKETRTKFSAVKNSMMHYLMLKTKSVALKSEYDKHDFFSGNCHKFWTNLSKISMSVRNAPAYAQI